MWYFFCLAQSVGDQSLMVILQNSRLNSCWNLMLVIQMCLILTYLLHGAESFLRSSAASQEIPRIFGTLRFLTVSARHLSVSWANSIQSPQPPPTSWRSILILTSHLCLGLLNGLFPSGFPTRTLCTPLPSPIRAICPAHLILLDFTTRTILGKEYRSLHSPVTSSLLGSDTLLNTLFSHPQPTFLPHCERPRFTPIQNNGQYYSSIVCLIHTDV